MKRDQLFCGVAAALTLASSVAFAAPGVLIASGDEWQLSDYGYEPFYLAGTTAFANSIAATFGGSNYLMLTGHSSYVTQANLTGVTAQFQGLGKTVSFSSAVPVDLTAYDAVFDFGQAFNSGQLANVSSYLAGGGNFYLSLGGGEYGDAAAEANFWNPFLGTYGLIAGSSWFTIGGLTNAVVTSGPPSVTNLIWGYGQSIEALPNSGGVSYIRGSFDGGTEIGLVGTSRPLVQSGAVPEPATWAMMLIGFGLIGSSIRGRRAAAAYVG